MEMNVKALSAIKEHPLWNEPRTMAGMALVLLSYLVSWPLISLLGVAAAGLNKPDLLLIGGPALYFLSYLLFFAGICLAGRKAVSSIMTRSISSVRRVLLVAFK